MDRNDNKGFWDRWAKRYDRTISIEKNTYARILHRMKEKLDRDMYVLELACGTGVLSVQLATTLPYAPETFDAVIISNALHIMPAPEKALTEIRRV